MKRLQLGHRIEEEEQNILRARRERMEVGPRLRAEKEDNIIKIAEACEKPDIEILREAKAIINRTNKLRTKKTEPDLKTMDIQTHYIHCDQKIEAIKSLTGIVCTKLENPKTLMLIEAKRFGRDLTFDPHTAHPRFILSEDERSVTVGHKCQDLPNISGRFDTRLCILGSRKMSSGRHYWEVDVGKAKNWDVGAWDSSAKRKGFVQPSPNNKCWAIGLDCGERYTIYNSPTISRFYPLENLAVIGVFVNCEAGNISFYNVEKGQKIFTFHPRPMPAIMQAYFCTGEDETLQLLPVTNN